MDDQYLESWVIPDNPAVRLARAEYNKFYLARHRKERIVSSLTLDSYACYQCIKDGNNHKRYPTNTMLHIEHTYYRNGRHYRTIRHLCARHAKNYVPHDKRMGSCYNY